MTKVDWIALGVIAFFALTGFRRGLIGTILSLIGTIAGAIIGARLAPHILSAGLTTKYSSLLGVAGAAIGVIAIGIIARFVRGGLRLLPPLRLLDSIGGAAFGALFGAVLVWVAAAAIVQLPGHPTWRHDMQTSKVVKRLNDIAPPVDILKLPTTLPALVEQMTAR
ncbi:MAG: hypothetical protein F2663_01885 [Actinobacteria bacterium]|uniref:Unannotated protein n=1 Tax=freshwater metagenome TaxID=449393 RepID=A0A6J6NJ86_9ZZZZ|nr:hypothetical protein [Actinomycetota bacterium]